MVVMLRPIVVTFHSNTLIVVRTTNTPVGAHA